MNAKVPATLAAAAFVFGVTLCVFSQFVSNWTSTTFSELGTFLGGFLGPLAILFAALQYLKSSDAQRAATKLAVEERHRIDLRNAFEKREERLDLVLDDKAIVSLNGTPVSLRELLGSALFHQAKDKLPDRLKLLQKMTLEPTGSFPSETVHLFEKMARVGIHLTALHDIAVAHDQVSGNNVLSAECGRTYSAIIENLRSLNYQVMDGIEIA